LLAEENGINGIALSKILDGSRMLGPMILREERGL